MSDKTETARRADKGKAGKKPSESRSREWQVTINNPLEKGFSHEKIVQAAEQVGKIRYYAMSDEIGLKEGTPHTHLYVYYQTAKSMSSIVRAFKIAHVEKPYGSVTENVDYVFKQGKWAGTEKEDTRVDGTQEEWGNRPRNYATKMNSQMEEITARIENGEPLNDILLSLGAVNQKTVEAAEAYYERLKSREVGILKKQEVYLHFGECGDFVKGTIKSRHLTDDDFYAVRTYSHPFDNYNGQKILFLDRYKGQLPYGDFIAVIDNLKTELDARYRKKQSLWTEVHVVCNWDFEKILCEMSNKDKDMYDLKEVLEKVDYMVYHFTKNGQPCSYLLNSIEYINDSIVMENIDFIINDSDALEKWQMENPPDWVDETDSGEEM